MKDDALIAAIKTIIEAGCDLNIVSMADLWLRQLDDGRFSVSLMNENDQVDTEVLFDNVEDAARRFLRRRRSIDQGTRGT
jgi:hypothetical protein